MFARLGATQLVAGSISVAIFLPLFLMIEWEEFGVDRIPYATMFSQEWHVGWGYGEIVLGAKYK